MLKEAFPPIETAMDMEPEELAPYVLRDLNGNTNINRYNYCLLSHEMRDYAGAHSEKFQERLMEAFIWLEREMFVAPKPDEQGEWRFITRRGKKILEEENFTAYANISVLVPETLNPLLARKVKPLFLRGDYDTAIFQAFKIVEVQVRKNGKYTNNDYGVDLMRKAFHPQTGPLTNKSATSAEKQAMSDLFSGAIGIFKNPTSHRFIDNVSPEDAADMIRTANFLLKVLGA